MSFYFLFTLSPFFRDLMISRSFTSLIRFISRYFISFKSIINRGVSTVYFSVYLLMVHRKDIDFYKLNPLTTVLQLELRLIQQKGNQRLEDMKVIVLQISSRHTRNVKNTRLFLQKERYITFFFSAHNAGSNHNLYSEDI